jgi:hypothetical protein
VLLGVFLLAGGSILDRGDACRALIGAGLVVGLHRFETLACMVIGSVGDPLVQKMNWSRLFTRLSLALD